MVGRAAVLLALVALGVPAAFGCMLPGPRGGESGRRGSDRGSTAAEGASRAGSPRSVHGAAAARRGSQAQTFDEMMALPPDEIDVARANFLLAIEAGFMTLDELPAAQARMQQVVEVVVRKLDPLTGPGLNETTQRLVDASNARALVGALNFDPISLSFDAADPEGYNPDNLFLHSVLERRLGYCVSLTMVAYAAADRLEIPVHPVRVPGHMFLQFGHGGPDALFFEMTAFGAPRSYGYYYRRFDVSDSALSNHVFLSHLDERQVFSDVTSNLGAVLVHRGDTREGLRWLEKATELDPLNAQAHYNLGLVYLRLHDPGRALRSLRRAIQLDNEDWRSLTERGKLYVEQGDPQQGFLDLDRAVRYAPERELTPLAERGRLRAERGQWDLAIDDLTAVLGQDAEHLRARVNLATLYVATARPREAHRHLDRLIELAPDHPAVEQLRRVLDRDP